MLKKNKLAEAVNVLLHNTTPVQDVVTSILEANATFTNSSFLEAMQNENEVESDFDFHEAILSCESTFRENHDTPFFFVIEYAAFNTKVLIEVDSDGEYLNSVAIDFDDNAIYGDYLETVEEIEEAIEVALDTFPACDKDDYDKEGLRDNLKSLDGDYETLYYDIDIDAEAMAGYLAELGLCNPDYVVYHAVIVSEKLGQELADRNEYVVDYHGVDVWLRTTTGQSPTCDISVVDSCLALIEYENVKLNRYTESVKELQKLLSPTL